jgi:ribonuclease D
VASGPPPTHRWVERDPAAAARLVAVRATVTDLAAEHTMPAENMLPPDAVRRISWEPPDPPDPLAVEAALAGYGARPWQRGLAAGPIAAAIEDPAAHGAVIAQPAVIQQADTEPETEA